MLNLLKLTGRNTYNHDEKHLLLSWSEQRTRREVKPDLDPGLIFDTTSSMMLYAMIFPPTSESWEAYIRRSLELILMCP